MVVNVGFIDNIIYDYEEGNQTPAWEIQEMSAELTWAEQSQLIKWYNKACAEGVQSTAHFKLVCVACDIIKKHYDIYFNKAICPSRLSSTTKKYINWKC